MSKREGWQQVFGAFDPLTPAGTEDRPELVRLERPYSPLEELAERLGFPEGLVKALVVGAPGAGKSTELLALLQRRLNVRPVLIDLHEHFRQRGDAAAMDRLAPWEVLVVVALGLYRVGIERWGHTWSGERQRALRDAIARPTGLPAEVDLAALASEVALLAGELVTGGRWVFTALRAAATSLSLKMPLAASRAERPDPLTDQDERVKALLHVVSGLLEDLREGLGERVLLAVDGVDRGPPELARRLFEESQTLAELPCHVVMTAPLGLRRRNLRGWTWHLLANVPVLERARPLEPSNGCVFFAELWSRRCRASKVDEALLAPDLVLRLGWASGGIVRVFCEMIQDVARRGWAADGPADGAMVDAVIDVWRRRWEDGITAADVKVLAAVAARGELQGHADEARLIDERCLVAWPNQSAWYHPHPLLMLRKVAAQP